MAAREKPQCETSGFTDSKFLFLPMSTARTPSYNRFTMARSSLVSAAEIFFATATAALEKAGVKSSELAVAARRLQEQLSYARRSGCKCAVHRVLIAMDASPSAGRAAEVAAALAQDLGAEAALVHVIDASPVAIREAPVLSEAALEQMKKEAAQLCQDTVARLRDKTMPVFIRHGAPAAEIMAVAQEWKADLIVMGSHGRNHMGKFFLGTTVEAVIREGDCPVLAVGPRGRCTCKYAFRSVHHGALAAAVT